MGPLSLTGPFSLTQQLLPRDKRRIFTFCKRRKYTFFSLSSLPGILDFEQVWSFFFKPRRISVSSHCRIKRVMTTNGSLVDLFKLVIAFHWTFHAKKSC
jgi:hypothetical protein